MMSLDISWKGSVWRAFQKRDEKYAHYRMTRDVWEETLTWIEDWGILDESLPKILEAIDFYAYMCTQERRIRRMSKKQMLEEAEWAYSVGSFQLERFTADMSRGDLESELIYDIWNNV